MKNKNGFSLVQVLIVGGILAAMGTYLMTMQQNITKVVKDAEANSEIIELEQDVKRLIQNAENCTASFAGFNFNTQEEQDIILYNTVNGEKLEAFKSNQDFPGRGIKLDKISYAKVADDLGQLNLLITKRYNKRQIKKEFNFSVLKDADGIIKSCSLKSENSGIKCEKVDISCTRSKHGPYDCELLAPNGKILINPECNFNESNSIVLGQPYVDCANTENTNYFVKPIGIKISHDYKKVECSSSIYTCIESNTINAKIIIKDRRVDGEIFIRALACDESIIHSSGGIAQD